MASKKCWWWLDLNQACGVEQNLKSRKKENKKKKKKLKQMNDLKR